MRAAVFSALEIIFVIIAVLIQSVVYAVVITCLAPLGALFLLVTVLFRANEPGWWMGVAVFYVSPVISIISSLMISVRWYRWLRHRRLGRSAAPAEPDDVPAQTVTSEAHETATSEAHQTATSETHAPLPEPRAGARPSTIAQAGGQPLGPHIRPRRAWGPPPPPPMPASGVAQRTPFSGGSEETGVESLNHEQEALPSLTPPIHSHSDDRSLASVLVLPCNHVALCPAVADMRSVTTCPVCGGGVREAIRQAQT